MAYDYTIVDFDEHVGKLGVADDGIITLTLTETPLEDDFLLLAIDSVNSNSIVSVSGMGAEWDIDSYVYNGTFVHMYALGKAPAAAGTVTVTVSSTGAVLTRQGAARLALVRGGGPNPFILTSGVATAFFGTNLTVNGPTLHASPDEFLFTMASCQVTTRTVVWPYTETPSTGAHTVGTQVISGSATHNYGWASPDAVNNYQTSQRITSGSGGVTHVISGVVIATDMPGPSSMARKGAWYRAVDAASGTSIPDRSGRGINLAGGSSTIATASTPNSGPSIRGSSGEASIIQAAPHPGQIDTDVEAATVSSSNSTARQYSAWSPTNSILGTSSWWASASGLPQWWQVKLKTAKVVTGYTLRVDSVSAARRPKDWKLQGSNDGSSWTDLDTQTAYVFSGNSGVFSISNSNAYLYYRINITANNGDSITGLQQVILDGVNLEGAGTEMELWAVLKSDGAALHPIDVFAAGDTRYYFSSDSKVYEGFGAGTRLIYTPTMAITSWRLLHITHDGTTRRVYLDGEEQASEAVALLPTNWSWGMEIGESLTNWAEIFIRNEVSTDEEQAELVTYFNDRHGLSVPVPGFTPSTTVEFPVGAQLGFVTEAPETTVEFPVDVALEAKPATEVTLPVTARLELGTATTVAMPVSAGLELAPATDVELQAETGLSFDATQPGTTELELPVSAGTAFDAATTVEFPVTAGFTAELVPMETSVDLPVDVSLVFEAEVFIPAALELELPVSAGSSFFVASRGSLWMPYAVAESGSQAMDFSIVPTSPEFTAPTVVDGDADSNSLWLELTSSAPQTLTVDLTGVSGAIELWTAEAGDGPDEIVLMASGTASASLDVATDQLILIRVHPLSAAYTGSGTVTWSMATRPESGLLALTGQSSLLEAPGWLTAEVVSATADGQLDFTVDADPTVVFTTTADELGLFAGGVWIPELAAGDHTLTVVDVSTGQSDTIDFTISLEVPAPGGVIPGGTPPPPLEVNRWEFVDPAPGGEVFTFPTNPSSMSTPNAARALTTDHTVYPGGQNLVWEGAPEPVSWQVEGTVLTQAHYEALERFHVLQRRFWVTDHMPRSWVVGFESLQFRKVRDPENPWAHTYTAKFLIVGGPVMHP